MHSQSLNETPLRPWLSCQIDGQVLSCHCTCKAGLGETCSHVAATLFYVDAVKRQKDQTACTSLPCQWNIPAVSKGQYKETINIDFSSIAFKKKRMEADNDKVKKTPNLIQQPGPAEANDLFDALKKTGTKCAVLALSKHSKDFIPATLQARLPMQLNCLFREELMDLDFDQLLPKCENLFENMTVDIEEVSILKITYDIFFRERTRIRLYLYKHLNTITISGEGFGKIDQRPVIE